MSSDIRRRVVAEGVIGLSLCLGAHFLLVEPLRAKLEQGRAEVARLVAERQQSSDLVGRMPEVMRALAAREADARTIAQRGAIIRDEGAMFTSVMSLAAHTHVQVEQMEPLKTGPGAPRARADQAAPPARPGDRQLAYSLAVSGSYADMCAFLGALQNDLAYTVVRSVRLTPGAGAGDSPVSAVIETAHYCFDVSVAQPAAASPGGVP